MTTPEVKRLVTRLDELVQSVAPPRDLWPAIQAEMDAATAQSTEEQAISPARSP